ncbi:MAG: APC family permease [Deltaproteobacteria bacterium]|nr:APC family permease [Deltaproteobacteria bacterium]
MKETSRTGWTRLREILVGPAKDLRDPHITHKLSLIAFLAWVGLGADGLSSSAYGPEEAYRQLGGHSYLALPLVLATAATVFIISYAYSKIIEHFPIGGGGYVVATQLLGKSAGVVSGCALLVDYVLTITVSIAGGGDALFSLLPLSFHKYKLLIEYAAIIFLLLLNIRGVKESVTFLVPLFLTFVATHVLLIGGGVVGHLFDLPPLVRNVQAGFSSGVAQVGGWGLFLIFIRAYSLGGGTYTGIEAVSNGIGIFREPKVATGKRTMLYMAVSLALTAAGLLLCFMLTDVRSVEGQTLNASLGYSLAGGIHLFGLPVGSWFVMVLMFSEALLLFIAAQTGFIGGPRVMANMATDSWLPRRFAGLSDRLSMQNGVLLIGGAAMLLLYYTQ